MRACLCVCLFVCVLACLRVLFCACLPRCLFVVRFVLGPSKIELSLWRGAHFAHFGRLLVGWLLEANLARFWESLGSQVEAKIHQKSIQEGIKNKIKF